MEKEGAGLRDEAAALFAMAWELAQSDCDKLLVAHYVARHQPSVGMKLHWDAVALRHALLCGAPEVAGTLSSLYLNIGKCHEDLGDRVSAREHYLLAEQYLAGVSDDGYGDFVRMGVKNALVRMGVVQE